jgi:hypothetical protein
MQLKKEQGSSQGSLLFLFCLPRFFSLYAYIICMKRIVAVEIFTTPAEKRFVLAFFAGLARKESLVLAISLPKKDSLLTNETLSQWIRSGCIIHEHLCSLQLIVK